MKKRFIKVIAGTLAITSMMAFSPSSASAAWKQNSTGWWYTVGNSWASNWKLIDGNWYYFYSNGYMAQNAVIDGCYVNDAGAWSKNVSSLSKTDAVQNVKDYLKKTNGYVPPIVEVEGESNGKYTVHAYSITTYPDSNIAHTATTGWYSVDKKTGSIFDDIMIRQLT
ncbi:hypothetical protein [uncultured Clostridium sp.]|uniref:hypothetical protein n=1 Tax=uncultured Clostridium sp. TaxID=59620 RepID=UPI0025FE367D|nr:hypothetical protein [uncultured Clostridium sp.]